MENLFFLALVAVVGLIRLLALAAENKRNREASKRAASPPTAPIPRASGETEEERIRKFMEALGVPKTSAPPRKVAPRPPKRMPPIDPFPLPRPHGNVPENPTPPIPAAPVSPPPLPTPQTSMLAQEKTAPPVPRQIAGEVQARSAAEEPAVAVPLLERLRTAEGLRDAIVLREIFGPPRSLQPLDLTRS